MLCFKTYFNSGLIGPVLKLCKGFIKYSYLQIQEKYFKNSKKTIEKSEKKKNSAQSPDEKRVFFEIASRRLLIFDLKEERLFGGADVVFCERAPSG